MQRAVNGHLAPEVVVRSAELVDAEFDARRSAQWRTYRYTIVNRDAPDPFRARYAWWVPEALDLARMRLASDPFLGEHDFSSFCRKGPEGSTTVRRVLASEWRDEGDGVLVYEIRAIVVLLADGAVDRRYARRRGDRQDPTGRHPGHPAGSRSHRRRSAGAAERAVPLGCGLRAGYA